MSEYENFKSVLDRSQREFESAANWIRENERDRKEAEHRAIVDSEQHLQNINDSVKVIDDGLKSERIERAEADVENLKYTKRWDRINLTVALVGLVIAIAGVIIALLR